MARTVPSNLRTVDLRCSQLARKRADPELLTPKHREWRSLILALAGYRCQAIENGARCKIGAPARLFADHIIERKDGGPALDPANGQCLCGRHHTLKTIKAREARMQERF